MIIARIDGIAPKQLKRMGLIMGRGGFAPITAFVSFFYRVYAVHLFTYPRTKSVFMHLPRRRPDIIVGIEYIEI